MTITQLMGRRERMRVRLLSEGFHPLDVRSITTCLSILFNGDGGHKTVAFLRCNFNDLFRVGPNLWSDGEIVWTSLPDHVIQGALSYAFDGGHENLASYGARTMESPTDKNSRRKKIAEARQLFIDMVESYLVEGEAYVIYKMSQM